MNSLVQFYRQQFPQDAKSDEEIMASYAATYSPQDLAEYPDFLSDWQKVQQRQAVEQSSIGEQAKLGLQAGITGLESSTAGLLSLGSSALGIESGKKFFADIYRRKVEELRTETPPSVPSITEALKQGPRALGQWAAYQGSAFVPQLGEAAAFGLAGSAVAPGAGSAAGTAGGFFARAAMRAGLNRAVRKELGEAALKELEEWSAGKLAKEQLSKQAAGFVERASKELASTAAVAANFAGIGGGAMYGEMSQTPGVTEEGAREAALIAGAGASIGAVIPVRILRGLFGETVSEDVGRRYVDTFAKKVPKELLIAGSGMGAMEFFNILAEKHADPAKRNTPLSSDDYSRMFNAIATGTLFGTPAAGIQAVRGLRAPKAKEEPPPAKEGPPPPPAPEGPAPAMTDKQLATAYGQELSQEQVLLFRKMADKDVTGKLEQADKDYLTTLPAILKAKYNLIKQEAQDAIQKRKAETVHVDETPGDRGTVVEGGEEHRAPDAEAAAATPPSPPESAELEKAKAALPEKTKAALKTAGIDPDALTIGIREAETTESAPTPVDEAIARARAKAVEEPAKPAPTPEPTLAPPAAKVEPAAVPAAPPDTSWLANVANAITAWRTPRAGKAETDMYADLGRNPKNKNQSKTLGVFQTQDGKKVIVASLYDNNGKKVFMGKGGKGYGKATSFFMDPVGYVKLNDFTEKFYREYTPEEWAEIQRQLEGKVKEVKATIPEEPTPVKEAVAVEAGLHEAASAIDEGRQKLTTEDINRLHDAVTKSTKGAFDAEEIRDQVSTAILGDPVLNKRLKELGGQDVYGLLNDILDNYQDVARDFQESGKTDPAAFRAEIKKRLQAMEGETPRPLEEYLASPDVTRDRNVTPAYQAQVRSILESSPTAYGALEAMLRAGLLDDYPIAKDLLALGDHGTRLSIGGAHVGADGRESAGRYDAPTHTANIYDAAFTDGGSVQTFLHEYVHANTVFQLETGRNRGEMAFLYETAREEAAKQKQTHYGLTSQAEFLAEAFTNPNFQNFLRSIKSKDINQTLWSRFVDWVGRVLGFRGDRTLLDDVISVGKRISGKYEPVRVQVPDSARTINYHTPCNVAPGYAERFNPVTGQIETAPLVHDSVEAVMHNVESASRQEYLLPTAESGRKIPRQNPTTQINNEMAIDNGVEELRTNAAAESGRTLDEFRIANGLHNTRTVREKTAFAASVHGYEGINLNQKAEDLHHVFNVEYVNHGLAIALDGEYANVSKNLANAKEVAPKIEAKHTKAVADHVELQDNFKDAEFMAGQIVRGVWEIGAEGFRTLYRVGTALGTAFQQFQDIEGKIDQPIDPKSVNVFGKLFTGEQLQGENLFNIMDQMANDPSLDFGQRASQIRAYIRHAADMDRTLDLYNRLSENTPEAKALLSTVISYGKLHRREIAMLAVRRMKSGEERARLEQELHDIRKESGEQLVRGIRSVAKASKLEEAAKLETRISARRISMLKRIKEKNDRLIEMNEKALPFYERRIEELTGKVQTTEDAHFGDGMVVRIPKSFEANPEWEERRVNLKLTGGPATTPEQIRGMMEQMAAWAKLRELAARNGDQTALGFNYQRVMRQLNEMVRHHVYDPLQRATEETSTGLLFSSDLKKMGSLGTPSAQLIERTGNKFVSDNNTIRNQADKRHGYKNQRLWNNVLGVLNREQGWWQRRKVTSGWFEAKIFNGSIGFLERFKPPEGQDAAKAYDEWYGKLGDWLMADKDVAKVIGDRLPEFLKAFRELSDSIYESGQWMNHKNIEAGTLVEDPRLGGKLRKAIAVGYRTFQRKFSNTLFNMVNTMRDAGWAEDEQRGVPGAYKDFGKIGELWASDPVNHAGALEMVQKYLGPDTVQKDFLFKLAHMPDRSQIRTPVLDESGTKIKADPLDVAWAYDDAGGDVVGMLQRLHDLYNGQEAFADYLQTSLQDLARIFIEMNSAVKKVQPKRAEELISFIGLVPNAMIDSRLFEDLPGDWFSYHKFDRNDNARMAERIAWQNNFGRDGRNAQVWHQTLKEEVESQVAKLRNARQLATEATPSGRKADIRKAAAKILAKDDAPYLSRFSSGEQRLQFLERQEKRAPFVESFLRNMFVHFNRGNQEEGSLRWGVRFAQELASVLVNQPASAISQLATDFDILMQWGVSPTTLKATGQAVYYTAKDIAGSLAQGVGWEFLKPSYYEKRRNEMGLDDPEAARRWGDIAGYLTGEETNPVARRFRQLKDIQSFTVNLVGEGAQYTPLRPLAPFFQTVVSANRALFVSLSNMADGYVTKGMEYLRQHPEADRLTADHLGLKGLERESFERWEKDHARYGLDFTEMVRGAIERADKGDKTILTNQELARINSVAQNSISLESNIATMPLWAFNNMFARFGMPLLGWSYRRGVQVAGMTLNTKDQRSLRAVRTALLGIAATGLGGLGLSLVVDAYSEDVLGKKRNIRNLRFPMTATDWQGLQERLNRVGTLGIWGELINAGVNIGTGQGDNRMLSVDQRVVALQSFQTILKAASAFLNQDFDPDYQHVVRPLASSLGGGTFLQYMQAINHAFDFDNFESRVVKRISAENYLRVVGRDLGMPIRTGGGGWSVPTPITPWIARMEYAAYGNDPDGFRAAYRGAIDKARAAGKGDPEDYVKKAYETRHPLRFVFSQVPSAREYREILANLDDTGREQVTEAIRLFNYYGSHLGINPFQGSERKDTQRLMGSAERMMNARLRAIGALP